MTQINHRRKNKAPVNQRLTSAVEGQGYPYRNGYGRRADSPKNESVQRTGRTDFLDKSLHGWGRESTLADKSIGAYIGNDFSNGHRGMARAVAGAKKFVRTRIRFHENAATKKLSHDAAISSSEE
jgi:hypothetical protein